MKDAENKVILYRDESGNAEMSVLFAEDDVWITQAQMAELYDTTVPNISMHISNIFDEEELPRDSTVKKFLIVRNEGNRSVKRSIDHYNLDVIIAVGYRIQSPVATRFRRWATQRLHEYIQKGFAIDDERLQEGGTRYFKELLQRIRDIRASERNFYQQVTDIYSTAVDYDPRSDMTREFFSTVQNKLHYAVHEHTAAELIYERADHDKPLMGMTSFKGKYIVKDDAKIAKNYLSEVELKRLGLLVSQFFDYAEFQAMDLKPMTMKDWNDALDNMILANQRQILIGSGKISREEAFEKAEHEYELYRRNEMRIYKSFYDELWEKVNQKDSD